MGEIGGVLQVCCGASLFVVLVYGDRMNAECVAKVVNDSNFPREA